MKRFVRLFLSVAVPALAGSNGYIQHNLVADTPGNADVTDANLVNPWGIAASATGPFWISDNGSGLATVYSTNGSTTISIASLVVQVPAGAGMQQSTPTPDPGSPNPSPGSPNPYPYPYPYKVSRAATSGASLAPVTGQVANTTTGFGKAVFLFCAEDGTISSWSSGSSAAIAVDNSPTGAVYKGMALGGTATAPRLYVANFNAATVEAYDTSFTAVSLGASAFVDPQIPSGFAPFNIASLNGNLYVSYAKQDSAKHDDVPGPGNGYVDIFDMNGVLKTRLIAGGALNSPWGIAIAPANFGAFSNMLLVGNFGGGNINAYDPAIGTSLGALQNPAGPAISISGLWALQVGNGHSGGDANAVYFTAGPGGEAHGLFGSLQAGPGLNASNPVVNGASFQPGIAENTFITIKGSSLSSTTRIWGASDFVNNALPTKLDGVSVTVDGKPAYVYYISPGQINALTPADFTLGPVQVTTSNQGLTSASVSATMQTTSPAFFISGGNYAAALHPNSSIVVGPTTLFPNNSTPAQPGETIELFATGFGTGVTTIPDGQIVTTPINVTGVTASVGGAPATVSFAGLVGAGVYQINVVIPTSTANGDAQITATIGSQTTPSGVLVSVHN